MGWSSVGFAVLGIWLPVCLSGGAALAAPRDFEAEISFVLPGLGERAVASGQGVAELEPAAPLESLALSGFVAGSSVIPVTDPLVSNGGIVALRLQASLRTGDLGIDPFAPPFSEPALEDGSLAIGGELRFCLLAPDCSLGIPLPLGAGSGTRGLGVGGVVTFGGSGTVRLSLLGAPFTLNTVSVTGQAPAGTPFTLLSTGSLHGPLSFTSTAALSVSGLGGRLGLVTPTRVASTPALAGVNDLPGFARVEIRLLPEPARRAPVLLLGAAALALRGGRRRARPLAVPRSETTCED
jgi:hypothetical protein